jgi:hypothetical protein
MHWNLNEVSAQMEEGRHEILDELRRRWFLPVKKPQHQFATSNADKKDLACIVTHGSS